MTTPTEKASPSPAELAVSLVIALLFLLCIILSLGALLAYFLGWITFGSVAAGIIAILLSYILCRNLIPNHPVRTALVATTGIVFMTIGIYHLVTDLLSMLGAVLSTL